MFPVFRRFASLTLAVAAVSLAGCEGAQQAADRAAQEKLAQAQQALAQNQLDAAQAASDAAASTAGLSPEFTAQTSMLQGELRLARAQRQLDQAQETELNVSRLLSQVRLATVQIGAIKARILSDQAYDPALIEDQLRAKIAQIQGGPGQDTWQSGNGGAAPTLSSLDAQISQLQSAIQQNRDQARTLSNQRTALAEQGDQLQQKSLSDQDQQSVDDVAAGADARQQAAGLAIEIDKLDAAVVHMNADLRDLQSQHVVAQKAIDDYNKQIADLDVGWKSVQQQIDAENHVIASIAGSAAPDAATAGTTDNGNLPPPPKAPASIADSCAQLTNLNAQVRDSRDKAAELLKLAIADFNTAGTAGDQVRREMNEGLNSDRTGPTERGALQDLQETYAAATARQSAANVERLLGMDYAAEAIIGNQVNLAMTAAQTALGTDAPAAVADCLKSVASPSVEDLTQSADGQFKNALDHFDASMVQTLQGAGAASRKSEAMAGKMIAAFAARQLSLAMQNKPIAGQSPKDLQGVIDDLATTLADQDPSMLPHIPYTIAAPATAPATQ